MIYTAWNIWKERNRRVFDGAAATPPRILVLIIEEMRLRDLAWECTAGRVVFLHVNLVRAS
jgi:hypothetical protein